MVNNCCVKTGVVALVWMLMASANGVDLEAQSHRDGRGMQRGTGRLSIGPMQHSIKSPTEKAREVRDRQRAEERRQQRRKRRVSIRLPGYFESTHRSFPLADPFFQGSVLNNQFMLPPGGRQVGSSHVGQRPETKSTSQSLKSDKAPSASVTITNPFFKKDP